MNTDPGTREKLRIVMNTYKLLGLRETVREIILYLLGDRPEDDFDQRYNVGTIYQPKGTGREEETPAADRYAVEYVPTRECVMKYILNNACDMTLIRQSTFVDLGCGKGRTLIIAGQFPFKRVVGVELSSQLYQAAVDNLTRYRIEKHRMQCKDIGVICGNALEFDLPRTDLFVYMYRPFLGPVFQGVLDRLHQFHVTTGHQVLVAYACPVEESYLEGHGGFTKLREFQVISTDYSWSAWECRTPVSPMSRVSAIESPA
ncbi:hypothetical protein W02_10460 [Nitrospira sp. KM1]|uniref:class I SAM-dependent methyltransferase n=1 Tax=Nitrospira sp. KM1 TaxID=1936990 RepID=UPI0013A79D70|nr:class I SAM-dependent methyltransferase [Nitrospira sp. KM1]BCA53906.1 hypothetical protein W02_10460 [Nitrospira sp. KM1]